jgi:AcrR family transcriptional regulator
MIKNTRRTQRGEPSLTRARIIVEAIALLDSSGESGLTFRALAAALATGAGAIYFHVADKNDLLNAACDTIVAAAIGAAGAADTPQERLRRIGLGLFDAIDAHAWVGAELARAHGTLPMLRIVESIGQAVRAMAVAPALLWPGTSSLVSYILGVAGQNAANARYGRQHGIDRAAFLGAMASQWEQLSADDFPFMRSVAGQFRDHDDRADFLAGIDLILDGIAAQRPR